MTTSIHDPFTVLQQDTPAPEIRHELMTVTPDLAREWTARNTHNRTVRYPFVAQLARDMKAGNWDVNGETIKIAADGTLLDGQHRLYACIQAETSFQTFVVTGLPPESQRTMDTGAKRRISDQLTLTGQKNATTLGSITRWAILWARGVRYKGATDQQPTHQEILAFIEADPRLEQAADFAVLGRERFGSVRASVYGLAYMIFTGINDIGARVFLAQVVDGANIDIGDPAHTLRARFGRARDKGERLNEHEQLALMVTAWNHFRAGTKITKLQLPKSGLTSKNFPEPK